MACRCSLDHGTSEHRHEHLSRTDADQTGVARCCLGDKSRINKTPAKNQFRERFQYGGGRRTRTFEAIRRLIYSQLPLPLGTLPRLTPSALVHRNGGRQPMDDGKSEPDDGHPVGAFMGEARMVKSTNARQLICCLRPESRKAGNCHYSRARETSAVMNERDRKTALSKREISPRASATSIKPATPAAGRPGATAKSRMVQ